MLTAPVDMVKLWPDLWPNRKAAKRTLAEGVPVLPGFEPVAYQLKGPKMKRRVRSLRPDGGCPIRAHGWGGGWGH